MGVVITPQLHKEDAAQLKTVEHEPITRGGAGVGEGEGGGVRVVIAPQLHKEDAAQLKTVEHEPVTRHRTPGGWYLHWSRCRQLVLLCIATGVTGVISQYK